MGGLPVKSTIPPGRTIGKYEIVKHLATGGMAEIYLARVATLPGLSKLVVLKRMLPDLAVRDDYVRMFLDEARIATLLDHPNIVHTFDAGIEGLHHVGMIEQRGDARLVDEHLHELRLRRQLGEDALQHHQLVEPRQRAHAREIDLRHAAGRQVLDDLVAADALTRGDGRRRRHDSSVPQFDE